MFALQRRAGSEQRSERHHGAFAQVVDRRIRNLRKPLAEIRRDGTGAACKGWQCRVVAHRRRRLVPLARGGAEQEVQILLRVARSRLPREQWLDRRIDRRTGRKRPHGRAQPACVRAAS